MNSFNRLTTKTALVVALVALGATAHADQHSDNTVRVQEHYGYHPGAFLGCDVGLGPSWSEMGMMLGSGTGSILR